jgi:hypothetical protein
MVVLVLLLEAIQTELLALQILVAVAVAVVVELQAFRLVAQAALA